MELVLQDYLVALDITKNPANPEYTETVAFVKNSKLKLDTYKADIGRMLSIGYTPYTKKLFDTLMSKSYDQYNDSIVQPIMESAVTELKYSGGPGFTEGFGDGLANDIQGIIALAGGVGEFATYINNLVNDPQVQAELLQALNQSSQKVGEFVIQGLLNGNLSYMVGKQILEGIYDIGVSIKDDISENSLSYNIGFVLGQGTVEVLGALLTAGIFNVVKLAVKQIVLAGIESIEQIKSFILRFLNSETFDTIVGKLSDEAGYIRADLLTFGFGTDGVSKELAEEALENVGDINETNIANAVKEMVEGTGNLDEALEVLMDGSQYTKSGRMTVLKSDITYATDSGHIYTTDSLGRIDSVEGKLTLADGTRNEYAQSVAGRVDRLPTDDGGHLIASRFGGSGDLDNLVPMDSNLNRSAWKTMENEWATALQNGSEVNVSIDAIYEGASQRPSEFLIEYFIDGQRFEKTFENIAGGGL